MHYCQVHQIAFETSRQLQGHYLFAHPGELRPKPEASFVEQVPEGTRIVPPPKERKSSVMPPPATGSATVAPLATAERPSRVSHFNSDDEDEVRLDQGLDGIGVPLPQRETIVKGWRNFPVLHQHPGNLENYIKSVVGTKFHASVMLVVHKLFPGAEPAPDIPYLYGHAGYSRRPGPMYWHGQGPFHSPWETDPYSQWPPPPAQWPPPPAKTEPDPQVVGLQKQFDGLLGELQAERADRAREKQEREAKERDAAWQSQLDGVVGKIETELKGIADSVRGLSDRINQGHVEVEASHTQQLTAEVVSLKETITNDRQERLQATVDALRGEVVSVNQKVAASPTGRTSEDLIADGIPLAVAELRSFGNTVGSELKAIRTQAGDGKLPMLAPPNPPRTAASPAASADPVVSALEIAGARSIEDKMLAAMGEGPRS